MTDPCPADLVIGVDTHTDTHTIVVLDGLGRRLDTATFATTTDAIDDLLSWADTHGHITRAGVEGTGDYGANLSCALRGHGVEVIEINRPDRARRRRLGKSDPIDAENAARAVLAGDATAIAKTRTGNVEAIRVLRVARTSAVSARTVVANQLHALVVTAPGDLHDQLAPLSATSRRRTISALPTPDTISPATALVTALQSLVVRYDALTTEIKTLDRHLATLVTNTAPRTLQAFGVGIETAGQLLCTIGANPERFTSPAAFAALCGASPIDTSSGRHERHRLNRGGDRRANRALWAIVFTRAGRDERTKAYIAKRISEGRPAAKPSAASRPT